MYSVLNTLSGHVYFYTSKNITSYSFLLVFTSSKAFILSLSLRNNAINCHKSTFSFFNPFMHNVVKWPNILSESCGVHTARFLKYVWPFYNIMHERVKWIEMTK